MEITLTPYTDTFVLITAACVFILAKFILNLILFMGNTSSICNPNSDDSISPGNSPGEGQRKITEKHLVGFGPTIKLIEDGLKDAGDIKSHIPTNIDMAPEDIRGEISKHIDDNLNDVDKKEETKEDN
jgi:hypothetical protein